MLYDNGLVCWANCNKEASTFKILTPNELIDVFSLHQDFTISLLNSDSAIKMTGSIYQ